MIGYVKQIISSAKGKPTPRAVGASLFTRKERTGLEELPFDLLIDESHGLDFDVSDHAVENGVTIADNIVQRLRQVRITGLFTNHPIQKAELVNGRMYHVKDGEATSTQETIEVEELLEDGTYASAVTNTAQQRWEKLQDIAREKRTVRIITSLEDYPAMVITHLSAERGPQDGEAVKFTMTLREIRTATVSTTTVAGVWNGDGSTPEGRAMSPEQNAGSQSATDAAKKKADEIMKGNVQNRYGG